MDAAKQAYNCEPNGVLIKKKPVVTKANICEPNDVLIEDKLTLNKANNCEPDDVLNRREQLDSSQVLRKVKRPLNISPSTPVGLQKKYQARDTNESIQVITFNQDVDMEDLELDGISQGPTQTDANSENNKHHETPSRKFIRGLRRMTTETPKTGAQPQTPVMNDDKANSNMKGISVRSLRQRSSTRVKNYKSTKKKNLRNGSQKHDKNQHVIDDFYTSTPLNNPNVVGLDTTKECSDDVKTD